MSDYIPSTLRPGSIVWAYVRDSGGPTQEQSVPQQESEITRYAKLHGLQLTRVFADVGKSGGSVEKRDQFLEMIDLTRDESNRPAGILVWNLARFSRDVDDSDFYKSTLRRRGIVIHSLTDAIPEGVFAGVVEKLVDTANAEYRRQNSLAVKRSIRDLVKLGYQTGTPPRGYIRQPEIIGTRRDGTPREVSRWIPDPELWDLIKLAWEMRAAGRSYGDIVRATDGKIYKSKNCYSTFFVNRSYLGEAHWGNLVVKNHHEAAVDLATFETVQALNKANPRGGLRNPMRIAFPSLLSGLAYCGLCGAAMVHHTGKHKNWPFYFCGKRDRAKGLRLCEAKRMSARKVDAIILDVVLNRVLTPGYFADLLQETKAAYADTDALESEIDQKRHELQSTTRAISNLFELVESFGVTEITKERLKQKDIERVNIQQTVKQLEAQRDALEIEITPEALNVVLNSWRDQIIEAKEKNDIGTVRSLLAFFVQRIEMTHDKVIIKYSYPDMNSLTRRLEYRPANLSRVGAPLTKRPAI